MSIVKSAATCLLLLPLALACSGGSSDDPFGGAGQGTVAVQVYDAPVQGIEAASITFSALAVHAVDGTWVDVDGMPLTIDLMAHVGPENAVTIGQGAVPAGTYDAVRFTVSAVSLTVDGSTVDLTLPESGISAAVGHVFTVEDGGSLEVEMHLNPATSFQVAGTAYTFTPTVDQVTSH